MQVEKEFRCHGGTLTYYQHESFCTKTPMKFSVYLPPQASSAPVPYLVFLSGLTCTEDNFTTKACAYRKASELGIAIIAPDTSPRGDGVPDADDYDLGQGAGFYLNATQTRWAEHFQMQSYIINELVPLVEQELPVLNYAMISGHSMGGHGALVFYLKFPELFKSCSAFSPIVAPAQVPWGQKAFKAYLGGDQTQWQDYDATALMNRAGSRSDHSSILIDQGLADQFLADQLKPELFQEACEQAGQVLKLRLHKGYDHSYFFIQTFIADHLQWHWDIFKKS